VKAETIQTTELAQAETRLPRWMMGLSVAGVLGALLYGRVPFAAGFALGAALAILNYFWLHQALEHLFATQRSRLPWGVVAKFAVRYPLAFGMIYFFYWTGWLPFSAILAGLFVPVGGVLIEAGIQIGRGWRYSSAG
jgi:hypothetical protein